MKAVNNEHVTPKPREGRQSVTQPLRVGDVLAAILRSILSVRTWMNAPTSPWSSTPHNRAKEDAEGIIMFAS